MEAMIEEQAQLTADAVARRSYGKLIAFLAARTRDVAAAEAHRQTPHYRDYLTRVPALADRTALALEALDVQNAGAE